MSHVDLARPLGLVLARFSLPLRASLMQILPRALRSDIEGILEEVEDLAPDEMSFVEQVLHADLQAIFSPEDEVAEERFLVEAWPLRVSDLLAVILRHASSQQAASALLRLPADLQGEVLHRLAVQDLGRLRGLLGRSEVAFLEALDKSWDTPARTADPAIAAEVLDGVPSPRAVRRLLTEMHRMDPEPALAVQDILYDFDDLVILTDLELQMVLNGVDAWDLALAFRSASPAIKRRLVATISERRAGHLAEDQIMVEDADEEDVAVVRRRLVA
ncbi:MAG: FliG C-terminal domain-containing protein, partial [Candidatus Latescibacteria bacterium]|nr:FliG C-terminal domain-containing protein [Candidatus Latescibacterota bacterium]